MGGRKGEVEVLVSLPLCLIQCFWQERLSPTKALAPGVLTQTVSSARSTPVSLRTPKGNRQHNEKDNLRWISLQMDYL